jgi:uncharacterized protein involved in exopolysaccharide biosynthesis
MAGAGDREIDIRRRTGIISLNGRIRTDSGVYVGRSRPIPAPRPGEAPAAAEPPTPGALARTAGLTSRYWKLIVLVMLACMVGAVAYLTVAPPRYRATAQVLVTPVAPDTATQGLRLIGGSEPTRSVQTAVALLDTQAAAVRTSAKLGGRHTPASVAQAVTVEPRGQSYIVSVSADAADPDAAALLANTFVGSALELRNEDVKTQASRLAQSLRAATPAGGADTGQLATLDLLAATGDPSLSLTEAASSPERRTGLPPGLIVVLAAVFGLVLGTAAALARNALHTPKTTRLE